MITLRGLLIVALVGFSSVVTAHAQCDRTITATTQVCTGGCTVRVGECAFGTGDCYYEFPGVQCSCNVNEYFPNGVNNPSACGDVVRPPVRASVKTAAGFARTFLIYLPNCMGGLSIEEVLS